MTTNELIKGLRAQASQHQLDADLTLFDVAATALESLTAERDALAAQLVDLRIAATIVLNSRDEDGITTSGLLRKFDELSVALSKTPAQCLAERDANTMIGFLNVTKSIISERDVVTGEEVFSAIEHYSNQLRQQAKGGE
jgi:hypothetical protein